MHGTNNVTSSMDIAWNKHHFFYGHCMEQTTSLRLWALHGTNNITSSMGIARTSPSFVWIHDFHQNVNKAPMQQQQQQVHPHFLDIITFADKNCTALAIVGFWTRTQKKNKQNKTKQTFNGWICLSMQCKERNQHCPLCQYKYH
jgi:hypothetical protein